MSRVLVKTGNPSWFIDAAQPDGSKVRKRQDDQIFDNLVEAQEALAVLQKAHGQPEPNGDQSTQKAPKAGKAEPPPPAAPKLVEVRCQWRGKDGDSGKRCPNVRQVKPQDVFQVKFCHEHQEQHRRRQRNLRAKAKRAEKAKAAGKAKAA